MNPSVRVVCGGCLRSVDVQGSDTGSAANVCPNCGGPIDSRASPVESPPGSFGEGASHDDGKERTGVGESIDWAKTWDRGSLGSLGRFQLRERLGEGGFGEVFLAYDPRLDRDVAVKVLKQADPNVRVMGRFFREARAGARLDHPNIVSVHDAGFDSGRCWVAYQHVAGQPLWRYRNRNRMDPTTAARIIRALADALDHAHRLGVVHRDIKPANVIIDDQGRPRLIDFGLARRSDIESDLTRDGAVVGTPAYMSPEQAMGRSREADERADVYSLGVILYELLGGRRREGSSPVPSARRFRAAGEAGLNTSADPAPPSIPAPLRRICARAMAQDPAARYPRARELADELDRWLRRRQTSDRQFWSTRTYLAIASAAVILIVIAVLMALFLWPAWHEFPASSIEGLPAGTASNSPTADPAWARSNGSSPDVGASSSPAAAPAQESTVRLIANRETRLYHRAQCVSVLAMAERNRYALRSARQAEEEGFRWCDRCHPPVFEPPFFWVRPNGDERVSWLADRSMPGRPVDARAG